LNTSTEPRFSLGELVEATGLSDRTIRYYIEQGIVMGAKGRGRTSYYTPEHLQRLARVADLRKRGLSLSEIRESVAPALPAPTVPGEIWERHYLHPMLELSLRSDAPEELRMLVRRFEQLAEQWFDTLERGGPGLIEG
jgi:DNA-binding transcriptional MerR regulator